MLRRMHDRREENTPMNLEENIRWLVTGQGRPIGCPEGGQIENDFLKRIEGMRVNCCQNLSTLIPNGQENSILDVLENRLKPGVDCERSIDEVVFNNTLSLHFEEDEADHALIRWLLEGEFLETERVIAEPVISTDNITIDTRPNRTFTLNPDSRLDSRFIVCGLPLHISSDWAPHGRGGPNTMGPAARLLCYWTRGEYLGSCSIRDAIDDRTNQPFFTQDECRLFEVRHGFTAPHRSDRVWGRKTLRRRIRLHALAKVEVFTMVEHCGTLERWVLRDMSEDRYKHALSESFMPSIDDNFRSCAQRGVEEELGISDQNILDGVAHGGSETKIEWGGGLERHDSRSMPGLPSMMCVNPFFLELNPSTEFVRVNEQGIPTRQFQIEDAGLDTTLNWLPNQKSSGLDEVLASFNENRGVCLNQWYALNFREPYIFLSELTREINPDQNVEEAHEAARGFAKVLSEIEGMIGATLLYHHLRENPNRSANTDDERLIGYDPQTQESQGLLFERVVWTSGVGSRRFGISDFKSRTHPVSSLVDALMEKRIVQPSKYQSYLGYLSSIGRVLQPEIKGEPAVHWLIRTIHTARRRASDKFLTNHNGLTHLLNWNLSISGSEESEKRRRWHSDLTALFNDLETSELWSFNGDISSLLRNQPHYQTTPRWLNERGTVVLFKMLVDQSFDVKLQENVDLCLAQQKSDLLNQLRERPNRSGNILDEDTQEFILTRVNRLRERQAMIVRLD